MNVLKEKYLIMCWEIFDVMLVYFKLIQDALLNFNLIFYNFLKNKVVFPMYLLYAGGTIYMWIIYFTNIFSGYQ